MPACSAQRSHSHLKVMDIVRTLGSRSLSVNAMLNFSGKANTSIHGLGEDDTSNDDAAAAAVADAAVAVAVKMRTLSRFTWSIQQETLVKYRYNAGKQCAIIQIGNVGLM